MDTCFFRKGPKHLFHNNLVKELNIRRAYGSFKDIAVYNQHKYLKYINTNAWFGGK